MNRIDRLSAILNMLQSFSTVKVDLIAERFNISIRTVYRDIKALEETGIPISGGAKEGYSLVEGFKLPPLMFTEAEALSFIAAEKLIDNFTDSGFAENYKSGIAKIRAVMRLVEKETIGNFDDKIAIQNFKSTDTKYLLHNILQIIMNGVSNKKRLKVSYYSHSANEVSDRIIDPIGIFFSLSNWYLIAYCNTKLDYRTFRINRVKSVIEINEDFVINHPPLNSFLKAKKDTQNLHEIIIEIDKSNILLLDENKNYQGLVSESEINGKIVLKFLVFSIEKFARWLLSYIDIAKIVQPKELIDSMDKILKARL